MRPASGRGALPATKLWSQVKATGTTRLRIGPVVIALSQIKGTGRAGGRGGLIPS